MGEILRFVGREWLAMRITGELERGQELLFSAAIPLVRRMKMVDVRDHSQGPDRNGHSGSEEYEVRHFAEAIGLDVEKVRELIKRHGEQGTTPERQSPRPKGADRSRH